MLDEGISRRQYLSNYVRRLRSQKLNAPLELKRRHKLVSGGQQIASAYIHEFDCWTVVGEPTKSIEKKDRPLLADEPSDSRESDLVSWRFSGQWLRNFNAARHNLNALSFDS
jgi:hypothetical protein